VEGLELPLVVAFTGAVLGVAAVGILLERWPSALCASLTPLFWSSSLWALHPFRGIGMMIWGKDAHSVGAFSNTSHRDWRGCASPSKSLDTGHRPLCRGWLQFFYRRTLTGKAMEACAINKKAAALLGIGTERMTLWPLQ